MDKVLICTYYWPPSGGAGVQRWLKLSKYLAIQGVEVFVVTVDPAGASYMLVDESLNVDVHPDIKVFTTKSFEPVNIYAKLAGKDKVPVAGFSNVDNQSFKQKVINGIRSNFFIPDPRRGWNKYAVRKALEVIQKYDIKHVITTSPPHSSQLIGLKLKKKLGDKIKWISDLRDPWTDIYYYPLLQHSFLSHKINSTYERNAVERSDVMITVGGKFKESFLSKSDKVNPDKIRIIPNGYDPEDFDAVGEVPQNKAFTIAYTGTLSDHYQPNVFFEALGKLIKKNPDVPIEFKLVGIVSQKIRDFATAQIGDRAEFIDPVSHHDAIRFMLQSHILLLITQGEEGTIPGKTFEYLASQRRIVCIGTGDVTVAIANCEAGRSFERNEGDAIFAYLETALEEYKAGKPFTPNPEKLEMYSRPYLAKQVIIACS